MRLLLMMLLHDCRSALETVGLDPAVGFLHRERPGRPSLALDIMEELRPVLADRVVLSLVNRCQLSGRDFETAVSGAVTLKEAGRKADSTIDGVRKAITRFETFTDFKDLASFNDAQAVSFETDLEQTKPKRSGRTLSRPTVL